MYKLYENFSCLQESRHFRLLVQSTNNTHEVSISTIFPTLSKMHLLFFPVKYKSFQRELIFKCLLAKKNYYNSY